MTDTERELCPECGDIDNGECQCERQRLSQPVYDYTVTAQSEAEARGHVVAIISGAMVSGYRVDKPVRLTEPSEFGVAKYGVNIINEFKEA